MDERAIHHTGPAALGATMNVVVKRRQGQVALVRRSGEPFGGHAADPFAASHIHLIAAARIAARIENLHVHGTNLHDGRQRPLLQP